MKNSFPTIIILLAAMTVTFTSCSNKTDATSELQKAASVLQKSDNALTPEAQAPQSASAPTPAPSASQEMNQAIAAYKSGKFEDAVIRLQTVRAAPVMSPQQRIAVNDAMAAVVHDLTARAAKGDAGAIQALKQYDQIQDHAR